MHLTRQEISTKIPIPRKGTKYIARASSHLSNSVPVVIAIRDMLHLAQATREVKQMIHQSLLKINGKPVKDYKTSIKLFNIFEAGKRAYKLTLSKNGKFQFEESKENLRICKITNKKLLKNNTIQLNLLDGSNILLNNGEKVKVGDSIYIDFSGRIKSHLPLEKGRDIFVFSGKYIGKSGKIESLNDKNVTIKLKDGGLVNINESQIIVI